VRPLVQETLLPYFFKLCVAYEGYKISLHLPFRLCVACEGSKISLYLPFRLCVAYEGRKISLFNAGADTSLSWILRTFKPYNTYGANTLLSRILRTSKLYNTYGADTLLSQILTSPTTQNSILRPPFRTLLNYSPVHHIITHFTWKAPFLSTLHVSWQLRNRPFHPFLLIQEQLKYYTNVTTWPKIFF
jgi:hypothetical protein